MLRLYKDAANVCTLIGLIAGFAALLSLVAHNLPLALTFILTGAVADVFDGPLARSASNRPDVAPAFGKELDTLADVCHSVLSPALWVVISLGLTPVSVLAGLVLNVAGVTRLAYFTSVTPAKPGHFIGVPVTWVPLVLAIVVNLLGTHTLPTAVGVLFALIMALAQTSRVLVPKFSGRKFTLFAVIAIGLLLLTALRTLAGNW